MEGLVALVVTILLVIYSSAIMAVALSWIRQGFLMILSRVLAGFAIVSGTWLAATLIDGNGVFVGGIPVLLGAFALINSLRRKRQERAKLDTWKS
jgi:hypothetical protein